jgi:hypothetical protein
LMKIEGPIVALSPEVRRAGSEEVVVEENEGAEVGRGAEAGSEGLYPGVSSLLFHAIGLLLHNRVLHNLGDSRVWARRAEVKDKIATRL